MTSCPVSPARERGPGFPSVTDFINRKAANPLFNLDPWELSGVGTIFTDISHSHNVKMCIMEFTRTQLTRDKRSEAKILKALLAVSGPTLNASICINLRIC